MIIKIFKALVLVQRDLTCFPDTFRLYVSSIKIGFLSCSETVLHHRLVWGISVWALAKNKRNCLILEGHSESNNGINDNNRMLIIRCVFQFDVIKIIWELIKHEDFWAHFKRH